MALDSGILPEGRAVVGLMIKAPRSPRTSHPSSPRDCSDSLDIPPRPRHRHGLQPRERLPRGARDFADETGNGLLGVTVLPRG